VEGRRCHVRLHGGSPSNSRKFHRRSILALAMLYDAMAYGHLEAEASVAHGSPAVDDSSCSIPDVDIPNRHFHVHGHVHGRMSDHVLAGDCFAKPALVKVKVEAWRVEPAPDGSEKLLSLESNGRRSRKADRLLLPRSQRHKGTTATTWPTRTSTAGHRTSIRRCALAWWSRNAG